MLRVWRVAERTLKKQTAVTHLGHAACIRVKGSVSGEVALTGTAPRNEASVSVCASLVQSWIDRFTSCLSQGEV